MKASNANKVISVLLSVAMCPMMVPSAAFAAEDDAASGPSSPSEQTQPADQTEGVDAGASLNDTIAPQSEATGEAASDAVPVAGATVNGYPTLEEAVRNATVDDQGAITYEVTGKVNVDSTGWVQVRPAAATNAKVVKFVGKSDDAEICITQGKAILADQGSSALSVEFSNLKLSKPNPVYAGDYGQATEYFTTWLRNNDAASNCVTYTNCEFPNGVCNNQYGKTVFDNCKFSNATSDLYNMWVYGGNVEIGGGSFTGARGVKIYTEGTTTVAPNVNIAGASFTGISEKAAIVVSKPATVTLSNVSATDCAKGLIQKAIEGSSEKVTLDANGTGIGGNFDITANTGSDATKAEFNLNAGTLTPEVSSDFLADGFTLSSNGDGTFGVAKAAPAGVAEVNGKTYSSLQDAINAASRNATVKLLADTKENVTISTPYVTLDLNGYTLNGGTEKGKPALTVTARVTVKDSSEAKTGTIMREDTAENSGVSSHYVIDIQGSGWLTFESGNVTNDSGNESGKGASLVRVGDDSVTKYPGLNIKGGNFTQNNFIVIKVDSGDLFLNGGTLNSTNSYAIEDWHRATIKGGTVNGAVAAWTYSDGHNSDLAISGGTVNGNVESVTYDGAEGKTAKVSITGGVVNGTLSASKYNSTETNDPTKATIEVTGGTFSTDPSRYLVESSTATQNVDGTYGVEKAYLAQVGDTSYYTMDEAFKAQTASGEAITLLRDYTTGSTFNSGTVARVVDLNGHTWTCTGTDANSAAFEINNPNASLSVMNGKVVSSQLVGLIPSAMSGTITYDNSTLTFEGVEATTSATSGIETNGNNTNDTVVLKDSTLNVPNGFGIYFPSSGTLTIDNSTINAKTMGAQVCSGNLNVNAGSTITVSGDPVEKAENDGAIQDGAAISIVNRPGYKGLGQIAITGGTFTAKGDNAAIKAYTWDSSTKQESAFDNSAKTVAVSGGTFSSAVSADLCAKGYAPVKNEDGAYDVKEETRGTEANPYTLAELDVMTRAQYAAAQEALGGTMYVAVGDYSYDKDGVLGNGERNDTPGQNPDHSKLNAYGENGYLNENNDGANGKNIVFVNGSITSGATGYTSIDNIGTSLLLAVPAYTNVTFKGITFNNVMSFNYQLYTSPWSQLGELNFDGCTFNGIIVGAIAAQTLTFNGCTFTNYTNTTSANNSNPTWIRPAYGNWTAGDNKGQGDSFQSLTKINFTGNTVTSTRPVKFEYISQWDIRSTVTVTNNSFDISKQEGDTAIKNVGLYLGAHTKTNAFDLVADGNKKSDNTAALYTIPEGETSLPLGSTVTNTNGDQIELTDALKWKAADAAQDKIVLKTVKAVASVDTVNFATLTEAINAAQDGQTVTLLADATEDATIAAGKNITLDLGGKTLTNTNTGKATLTIAKGATATVKNGSIVGGTGYYTIDNYGTATLEDVTATAGNTDSSMIRNDGTLTIESGSYSGGLNVVKSEEDSTLNINGGRFELSYATSGYTGVVFAYGNTTITGGEFVQSLTTTGRWNHPQVIATGMVEGHPSFTKITGGTFTNKYSDGSNIFRGVGKGTSDNFEVSGGTFNKSVPSSYFADGLTCAKNADGTYGIATAIAQIGTDRYTSLKDAISAAKKGKTVQLLNDTTENITIKASKQITLDLNGHTLNGGTGNAKAAILNRGNVTITDTSADKTGTIKRDDQGIEGETSYYVIDNNGTMVIDQANVVNNSGIKGSSLIRNGGVDTVSSLTINGGTFEQQNFIAVKNDSNGELTINGGTLTSKQSVVQNWNKAQILGGNLSGLIWTDSWTEAGTVGETVIGGDAHFIGTIYMDVTGPNPSTLKIEGGSLDVTKWTVTDAAAKVNADIAVSGGTFTAAVPENYCAEGYAPAANADGTYGVKLAEGAYLLQNYRSGDQASWTYPTQDGMAFAGWYKDASFKTACTASDVEGAAYAKFVPITDLLQYKGGSLRMDVAQPSELTWLRFGYTMALPEGASFVENGWYFKKVSTSQPTDVRRLANNNVLNIDGTITANLVFTGVTTDYYSANFSEKAFVKYVTADGTTVEAVESDYQVNSVLGVADVILAHPMASKAEKNYAARIKAAV